MALLESAGSFNIKRSMTMARAPLTDTEAATLIQSLARGASRRLTNIMPREVSKLNHALMDYSALAADAGQQSNFVDQAMTQAQEGQTSSSGFIGHVRHFANTQVARRASRQSRYFETLAKAAELIGNLGWDPSGPVAQSVFARAASTATDPDASTAMMGLLTVLKSGPFVDDSAFVAAQSLASDASKLVEQLTTLAESAREVEKEATAKAEKRRGMLMHYGSLRMKMGGSHARLTLQAQRVTADVLARVAEATRQARWEAGAEVRQAKRENERLEAKIRTLKAKIGGLGHIEEQARNQSEDYTRRATRAEQLLDSRKSTLPLVKRRNSVTNVLRQPTKKEWDAEKQRCLDMLRAERTSALATTHKIVRDTAVIVGKLTEARADVKAKSSTLNRREHKCVAAEREIRKHKRLMAAKNQATDEEIKRLNRLTMQEIDQKSAEIDVLRMMLSTASVYVHTTKDHSKDALTTSWRTSSPKSLRKKLARQRRQRGDEVTGKDGRVRHGTMTEADNDEWLQQYGF